MTHENHDDGTNEPDWYHYRQYCGCTVIVFETTTTTIIIAFHHRQNCYYCFVVVPGFIVIEIKYDIKEERDVAFFVCYVRMNNQ